MRNLTHNTTAVSTRVKASRPRFIEKHEPASLSEVWGKRLIALQVVLWPVTLLAGFDAVLLVLNLAGLILAVTGLRWRGVGLLGVALLCTLDALTRNFLATGGLWRWNTLNYWLVLVILINITSVLKFNDVHTRLLQALLVLMVLMLSISLIFNTGVQDVLNIATSFGIIVYFMLVLREKHALYWMGLVCGMAGFLGGAMYYLQIESLRYVNPNSWAQFPLTALFAICLAMPSAVKEKKGRLIFLFLAVVNLVWIFLSGSRGSLLTAFVCMLYLVVMLRSFTWRTLFIGIGLVSLYLLSNFLLDQQLTAIHRFEKMFNQSYTLAERTSGRSELIETGIKIFQEQPLGIGTGSFRFGAGYLNILGGQSQPAHSAWIKVLAENGILGFLLLTGWVISFLIVGMRSNDDDRKAIGILTTIVLAVSFISKEFQGKDLWFLVAGTIVYLHPERYLTYMEVDFRRKRRRWRRLEAAINEPDDG